jgi:hypothetical protein
MGYDDILATMEEGAEQQADEVGASQWTQPPPVFDSAVTVGCRRSDHSRRSDTGRQIDIGCSRLVAGGDIVSRPARTAGRQGTRPLYVQPGPDLG